MLFLHVLVAGLSFIQPALADEGKSLTIYSCGEAGDFSRLESNPHWRDPSDFIKFTIEAGIVSSMRISFDDARTIRFRYRRTEETCLTPFDCGRKRVSTEGTADIQKLAKTFEAKSKSLYGRYVGPLGAKYINHEASKIANSPIPRAALDLISMNWYAHPLFLPNKAIKFWGDRNRAEQEKLDYERQILEGYGQAWNDLLQGGIPGVSDLLKIENSVPSARYVCLSDLYAESAKRMSSSGIFAVEMSVFAKELLKNTDKNGRLTRELILLPDLKDPAPPYEDEVTASPSF